MCKQPMKNIRNLANTMRDFALSCSVVAQATKEYAMLLKRLKMANVKMCNYINYKHYNSNRERVKYKIRCSFYLQKNYKKLQRVRNAVLKTTK